VVLDWEPDQAESWSVAGKREQTVVGSACVSGVIPFWARNDW